MTTEAGRTLSDLRVCDLKEELEKRSLEVTGNKNVLIERLQKALEEEGHDPDTYMFVALDKRTPKKPLKGNMRTEKVNGDMIDPNIVIKVEINDDEDEEEEELVDEIGTVDNEEYDENDVSADASNTDTGVNDNEESINLTIEEDEQKLLHAQAQDDKDKKTGSKAENGSDGGSGTGDEKENNKTKGSEDTKKGGNSETAGGDDKKKHTDDDKKKKDDSEQKSSSKTATSKDEKDKSATGSKSKASSSSRNLWVSGLSSITRASDLKTIFSKYGKVIGAKVVTNTRTPGTRCYGYVTMASSSDTSKCIEHLHRTELHGRIISVERTKSEISGSSSSATSGGGAAAKKDEKAGSKSKERRKSEEKEGKENEKKKPIVAPAAAAGEEETTDSVNGKKLERDEKAKSEASSRRETRTSRSSRDRNRPERPRRTSIDRERDRQREILSFQKIREERERQRLRERERELREEERRRREIRRRQREEEQRLAREREKLREERERLEREKAELLRLERERQKLEREKIELERLELKRQQMKIMQSSRIEDPKRAIKRPAEARYTETDRKRSTNERRFEAPPPPRFDTSLANRSVSTYDRTTDKKRDDYTSSKRDDYKRTEVEVSRHSQHSQHSSNYQGSRDTHNTHKDSRYTEPDTRSNFRRGTDDRDSRNSGNKRFEATSYTDRTSGSTSQWHNQGPPAIKSFAGSNMGSGGGGGSGGMPVWQSKSSSDSHWKPVDSSQDRYDRTYNERSGQYVDFSRQGMFVGRPQDRYSGQMSSRYQNGEY